MKKFYPILAQIASVVCLAFVLTNCSSKSSDKTNEEAPAADTSSLSGKIAFVNIDSLLANYNYSKDANETLLRKQEDSRATLNQKGRQLEGEAAEFQRKVQNNAFLTQERAQQEQQRLLRKQQELQQLEQRLTNELMTEQQKMNLQIRDSVNIFLKDYNKKKGYSLIFSNTFNDNILLANPSFDITQEVIDGMNARYKSTEK